MVMEAEDPGRRAWPMAPTVSAEDPAAYPPPPEPAPAPAATPYPVAEAYPVEMPVPAHTAVPGPTVPGPTAALAPAAPRRGRHASTGGTGGHSGTLAGPDPGRSRRRILAVPLVVLIVAAVAAGVVFAVRQARHDGGVPAPNAARTAAPVASAAGANGPLDVPAGQPSVAAGPSSGTLSRTAAPADPNLLAADEFTGTAANPDRWGLYTGTASNGALWRPSADQVSGGLLHIVATGRNPTGAGNIAGGLCWCFSGGDRLYGTWKVRARFDPGTGYAPVIGLWPNTDSGNDGMINFDASEADRQTLHTTAAGNNGTWIEDDRKVAADLTGWHTYTVEWRATVIRMYLDARLVYDSSTSAGPVFLPHTPMHLIIQVDEGPDDSVPAPDASTPDRVVTYIDWVRMYR